VSIAMTAGTVAAQKKITVPAGTRILIRTADAIDSSKQKTGFRFTANLETNLQAENTVVAPRGSTVYGRLAQASSAGRMSGSSELTLELTDIVINGTAYLRIPDHADQRSDRMPIIDSGPWRSGFRTMAITDSGLIPIS
jgi:hypothetical protein